MGALGSVDESSPASSVSNAAAAADDDDDDDGDDGDDDPFLLFASMRARAGISVAEEGRAAGSAAQHDCTSRARASGTSSGTGRAAAGEMAEDGDEGAANTAGIAGPHGR